MDILEQSTAAVERQSTASPKKEQSTLTGPIENTIALKGMSVGILANIINQINRLGNNKLYPAVTPSWKEPMIKPECGTTLIPNSPNEGSVNRNEAIALQMLATEIGALFKACGEDSKEDLALMKSMQTKFGITEEYEHDAIVGMADFRDLLRAAAQVRDGSDRTLEYDDFDEALDSDNLLLDKHVVKTAVERIETTTLQSLRSDAHNNLDDRIRAKARMEGAKFASRQYLEVLKLAQQTPR